MQKSPKRGEPLWGRCPIQRRLVVRRRTSSAALLLEAVAAINRAVAARLEGYLRGATTVGAHGVKHLALAALVSAAATTAAATAIATAAVRCLAGSAAIGATRGGIVQSTACVEFLLTGGEGEILSTITATERLVLIQRNNQSFLQMQSPAENPFYKGYFFQGASAD
jgi:hypothetical protein